jgi:hypothetical protein
MFHEDLRVDSERVFRILRVHFHSECLEVGWIGQISCEQVKISSLFIHPRDSIRLCAGLETIAMP